MAPGRIRELARAQRQSRDIGTGFIHYQGTVTHVDWLSARDHLVMGENESHEGPLEVFPEYYNVFKDRCDLHLSKTGPEGVAESGWCGAQTLTFHWISTEREIPSERGSFSAGKIVRKPKGLVQCDQGLFSQPLGSRSTREIKTASKRHPETCSLVLVTLGCVQVYFQVPFIRLWTGCPDGPVRKVYADIRRVSRLKQKISEMRSESMSRACVPAPTDLTVNIDPCFY
ncbi:hypothetical protein CRG98_001525 [Punica granatum]|uniref:Uncharacterized protein n=1 Tax=Punica granatum TaxID=22663 RepID=A0A2I0LBN2_PUNGR|nr:hypothetical protein CRG98_001525 [Punica granatum]